MRDIEKKIYFIAFVLASLAVLGGFSYAYFLTQITGSETSGTINSNTPNLSLTFNNGNNQISGENIAPGWTSYQEFSVQNTGSSYAYYDLIATDITNTFTRDDIFITITSSNGGTSLPEKGIPVNNQSLAYAVSIASGVTHNYTVKIEYKNQSADQSADLGKTFSFKIGIKAVADPSAKIKGLLSSKILGEGNSNVQSAVTIPGQEISKGGEAVLASAEDDYGTSYYFRGAVENNYVLFAGMCWRIVRVVGDGSIKLVLYNYNSGSVENPCATAYDGGTNAFARYSGTTYIGTFNTNYNCNAHIGLMYGTPNSATYALEHANTNKSTILSNLETWYNLKLTSYENYLADTIWCNDKSLDTKFPAGTGFGAIGTTYYSARGRLYANGQSPTQASPSLICGNDSNGGNLSRFTVSDTTKGNGSLTYKIGLLTADEIAYAGAIYSTGNSTYYLNKNATSGSWWSLSPSRFSSGNAGVYFVNSTGNLGNSLVNNTLGLRPAVSIDSKTRITGVGTNTNPYKVV